MLRLQAPLTDSYPLATPAEPTGPYVRLSYTAAAPEDLRRGVHELADLLAN